jgi:hypothetical protein
MLNNDRRTTDLVEASFQAPGFLKALTSILWRW